MLGVDVELSDGNENAEVLKLHVNFDDRDTIRSDKGDDQAFVNGIAVRATRNPT